MPYFLDQIEHFSKRQLLELAVALREEILQLRPDEFENATTGDSRVYETRWHPLPSESNTPKPIRLLLIADCTAMPPAIPVPPHVQLSRMEIDSSLGWAPQVLADRLRERAGQFDAVAYYTAVQAADPHQAQTLLNGWCTALALAAVVASQTSGPRLWLITRRGQALPGDAWPVDLGQAPLTGLGKSLSLEHPAAWGGCVDIDDEPLSLERAFAEIAEGIDDEVAYRAGVRHVPMLERFDEALPAPAPLRPDGSYLVTGGLGGVGSALVGHLLARGVARVVVFARSGPSLAASEPLLASWRSDYPRSRVELIEVDLANVESVSRGLAAVRRSEPVLRGIFHAAGSGEQVALAQLDRARIERVVCAKALGALYLDTLTREDALDFQVYFSSISGSWGTASMAPYAMANRFLDALSAHRNRYGRVTRSIAWGPWANVGLIVKQNQEGFAALGLRLIEPAPALHLLDRLIGIERAQLQAVDVDWERYAQSLALDKHLRWFRRQISTAPVPSTDTVTAKAADDFSDRQQTLALLREMVAQLLGEQLRDGAELRPMQELGLTSLLSVELSQKIRHRLGVACRPTVVFDYPSLDALAKELSGKWSQANPVPAARQPGAGNSDDDRAIAIIGMACALPGANSPDQLWERLEKAIRTGEDVIDRAPGHRFDLARYGSAEDVQGKAYTLAGGYLDDIAGFDHALFHLSRREAQFMDPQQRLALETTWRALEDAGIDPAALLRGDPTGADDAGVFFGIGQNEYGALCRSVMDGEHTGLMPTGQSMNIIAGRIAHMFGLQGPAIAYDTACSSSLVALDAAVRHLREGRNSLAVVGGVNALVAPESFVLLAKAGALSKHGRGAAFDARADGYVRAEGCVVMLLKRLADARADGNTVHAIIRGSAVNNDGRSSGLTAPNGRAQEQVMSAALRDAGVAAGQVALVEAHGTGTRLGDPIEYHALRAIYADEVPRTAPLQLGTLKAFIGHTESASGLAGLLKLVLSLRKRIMPAQLHYATLNPFIDASDRIEIPTATRPLDTTGRLLGAVSSFGFSGTNAHVIVERGDDGASRRIPPRPFERVHCWYSERPLPDSTGLAQAFASSAPQESVPECYIRRWEAPAAEPGEPVGNVLLLRPGSAGELYHRVRDTLLVRGVRIVEADYDAVAGLHGSFDRAVLCLEALQPLDDRAVGTAWLDGLAGTWSVLAPLLTAPLAMGRLLVFDASGSFAGDSVSQWSAVLACCAKERPGFSATLVQCEGDAAGQLPHYLDGLLATTEPVCVLSNSGAQVPRLTRLPLAPASELRLAADRSYLVSGGLGGLGANLIGWLLERGARHIVNLNRRAPNAEQAEAFQQLERRHGARIVTLTVDLADLDGMQKMLGSALPDIPPLAGVFHCAGTLDEDLVERQSWQRAQQVLRSKFVGAWNLHLTTLNQPLEHFVVFSSLTVLLGQAGQASYALANALAERLVAHRRAHGLAGLAIQWGPWSGAGMASRAGDGLASSYRNLGLSSFGAGDYFPVLSTLMSMSSNDAALPSQVGVFHMDWVRYFSTTPHTPFCADLGISVREKTGSMEGPSLAQRLEGVAPERRPRLLRDRLKQMVADCLNLPSVGSITDWDGFAELGIDSLHSTFLQKRLEKELRSVLPPTIVFDYPTTAALAGFLAAGPLKTLFPTSAAPADMEEARMRSLGEADLASILAADIQRLNQLGATS